MAEKRITRVPPPVGGLNVSGSVEALAKDEALVLENLLVGRDGAYVTGRGGVTHIDDLTTTGSVAYGCIPFDGNVMYGVSSADASDGYEFGPYSLEANLNAANQYTTLSTGVTTVVGAGNKNNAPANNRSVRIGSLVFYLSHLTTGTAPRTVGGYRQLPSRRVASWDGGATFLVRNTGPMYSADIALYAERLFVLGGTEPNAAAGAGTYRPNYLFYSDPGGPTTDVLTAWQDDVSGLTSQLVVGEADDFGVALCPINNGLLILKRRSLWVLRGSGPQTFQIRRFGGSVGCSSAVSAVPWRDGCLFLSDDGLYYFDGSQLTKMSEKLGALVPSADGSPLVPIGSEYFLTAAGYVLHAPSRTWCRFTWNSSAFTLRSIYTVAVTASGVYTVVACTGSRLVDLTQLVQPTTNELAGIDLSQFGVHPYSLTWTTGSQRLASFQQQSHVTRAFLDHYITDDASPSSSVTVKGYDDYYDGAPAPTVLNTQFTPPVAGSTYDRVHRESWDVHEEAETYALSFSTVPTDTAVVSRFYGAGIEWQPARQQRP